MFEPKRIFQHSNQVLRARLPLFLIFGLVLCALISTMFWLSSTWTTDHLPPWFMVLSSLTLLGGCLYCGAITHVALYEVEGRTITTLQALIKTLPRLPHLMFNLAIAGCVIALASFMCLVPGIVAATMFCVLVPATLCDPIPSGAFRRSSELTHGNRFLLCSMFAMPCAVYGVVVWALHLAVENFYRGGRDVFYTDELSLYALFLGILATTVFTSLYLLVLSTVTFRELRTLKEGIAARELRAVFHRTERIER